MNWWYVIVGWITLIVFLCGVMFLIGRGNARPVTDEEWREFKEAMSRWRKKKNRS